MMGFSIMSKVKLNKKFFLILLSIIFFWIIYSLNVDFKQKSVIQLYYDFLDGNCEIEGRSISDIIVPTGEPARRYATDYIILDSNGDDMPELHIRNAREFLIFSYRDDELFVFQSFFSEPWNIHLLENGSFIFNADRGNTIGEYYRYFELDIEGNKMNEIEFYWDDINEDYISDEKDQYVFDGNVYSMREWYEWTEEYIYVDKEGRNQLCNEVEWEIYCRGR